eukprot:GHUV01031248.1.p1 GENE.GHUV01031248.1~~GHUV01031248.1.p1  ORF type:complete len:202 (+),score=43.96 GHUV01031248.1:358-963(+)
MENEWKAEQVLKQLEDIGAKVFFEKQLTSSDVSASGRVVVPKAIAEQYFPRIDNPSGTELGVEDAAGDTYTLRFRFWINNQSRMYLLEGTAELQHHYHLKMGDVLIFAQKEDSTIVLAGRPPTKADAMKKPPVRRPSPTPGGRAARRDQVGVRAGGHTRHLGLPVGNACCPVWDALWLLQRRCVYTCACFLPEHRAYACTV